MHPPTAPTGARPAPTRSAPARSALATLAAAAVAVATVAAVLLPAAPARAESYRYWSYWIGQDGTWQMAQTGPGDRLLSDRSVEGWRFGVFGVEGATEPATASDFAQLCPDSAPAPEGQVRVAVVLDAGAPDEAPAGQSPFTARVACVQVPEGSTGYQALSAAGDPRIESGMVCGIDGYPAGECAAQVEDAADTTTTAPTATDSGDDSVGSGAAPTGTADTGATGPWRWLGLALMAVGLSVLAWTRRARNRRVAARPDEPRA